MNDSLNNFLSFYQSLLDSALDPYRREIGGLYSDREIGDKAESAFREASFVNKNGGDEKKINDISISLLEETNTSLSKLFLQGDKEYAYMPDLRCYKRDVSNKINELTC